MLVVTTSWGRIGKWTEIYEDRPVFADIHGGTAETSVMLAMRPDLVDLSPPWLPPPWSFLRH